MKGRARPLTVCLIGDPPSERFHSMEVYAAGLAGGLAAIPGVAVSMYRWTELPRRPGRYVAAVDDYWRRFVTYPRSLVPPPADVYHVLDHSYAHLIDRLPAERTVVTCHDLMPLTVSGGRRGPGSVLATVCFRYGVSRLFRSRYVIVDSEATKQALRERLGLAGERIVVVRLGVDHIFSSGAATSRTVDPDRQYRILQVGATHEPYKNAMAILQSFALLKQLTTARVKLLKVGWGYTKEQCRYIDRKGLGPDIEQTGYVQRHQLPGLYHRSSLLVMPSLCEGFGMPILEAMACGLPVVTSARGAIPEVAGDAVRYVNPADPGDIATGMMAVLQDKDLRQRLIVAGRARAARFTWDECARGTHAVYSAITQE